MNPRRRRVNRNRRRARKRHALALSAMLYQWRCHMMSNGSPLGMFTAAALTADGLIARITGNLTSKGYLPGLVVAVERWKCEACGFWVDPFELDASLDGCPDARCHCEER